MADAYGDTHVVYPPDIVHHEMASVVHDHHVFINQCGRQ